MTCTCFCFSVECFHFPFWNASIQDNRFLYAAPIFGYGFAWVGHFFFEKNRPATFKQPFYSLMGDFMMWYVALPSSSRSLHSLAPVFITAPSLFRYEVVTMKRDLKSCAVNWREDLLHRMQCLRAEDLLLGLCASIKWSFLAEAQWFICTQQLQNLQHNNKTLQREIESSEKTQPYIALWAASLWLHQFKDCRTMDNVFVKWRPGICIQRVETNSRFNCVFFVGRRLYQIWFKK